MNPLNAGYPGEFGPADGSDEDPLDIAEDLLTIPES
jgi:hypothetical protein